MLRDEIIEQLRADRRELDTYGVEAIGVFGSVARGDDRPDSDVDIVVDFLPESMPGLFRFAGLKLHLEALLSRPVDLVTLDSPNSRLNEQVQREAVYAEGLAASD
jgi:uncharacterized protein